MTPYIVEVLVNVGMFDVLALLEKLAVQKLWTLQGLDWGDVVRVVPRFADPRIQSNFVEN